MSGISASDAGGIKICQPSYLYNALVKYEGHTRAVLDPNYLVLFDVRNWDDYDKSHCLLAKHVKMNNDGSYKVPFSVDLKLTVNCIVYDSNTVTVIENTQAVLLARQLANSGCRNTVYVLKGGYERFSAEYPFLRTAKIMYTPLELEHLPLYPVEVLPLFLYLGDRKHAYNRSLNHDLKISSHLNMAASLHTAFPDSIQELHVPVSDTPDDSLLDWFDKICEFIETCRKKSERVLVFSEEGISRSPVAVIAYLIKYKAMSLKDAFDLVHQCRTSIRPLKIFMKQLEEWSNTMN